MEKATVETTTCDVPSCGTAWRASEKAGVPFSANSIAGSVVQGSSWFSGAVAMTPPNVERVFTSLRKTLRAVEAGKQQDGARTCRSDLREKKDMYGPRKWDVLPEKSTGMLSGHAEMGSGKPMCRWNCTW